MEDVTELLLTNCSVAGGNEDTKLRQAAERVCKFDWGMAMIGENYHAERVEAMRALRAAIESEER